MEFEVDGKMILAFTDDGAEDERVRWMANFSFDDQDEEAIGWGRTPEEALRQMAERLPVVRFYDCTSGQRPVKGALYEDWGAHEECDGLFFAVSKVERIGPYGSLGEAQERAELENTIAAEIRQEDANGCRPT